MLPEAWAKFYAASLSLALRHIHSKGFVYRDLKPENVLLDERGYLKLADLGLSKKVGENRTYTQCGTEEYADLPLTPLTLTPYTPNPNP